ncbi:VWA domain-containing protein [Rhodococcus sp. NPDC058521]|uniref:VWA domain-containing protein n=1 Tax=Rhodococcus sp. NPDC058521 TaxID=3346536 RepID=UPI00364E84E1
MTQLWERHASELISARSWAVCEAWCAGGEFGLLLAGDAWAREQLWLALSRRVPNAPTLSTAHHVDTVTSRQVGVNGRDRPSLLERCRRGALLIPSADTIASDVAAALRHDRILASAGDPSDVPEVLARRLTVVVFAGVRPVDIPVRIDRRQRDLTEGVVTALSRNGIDDHLLDIGATRFAHSAAASGLDALSAVVEYVIRPRLVGRTGTSSAEPDEVSTNHDDDGGGGGGDSAGTDSTNEGEGVTRLDGSSTPNAAEGDFEPDDADETARITVDDPADGDTPQWEANAQGRLRESVRPIARRGLPQTSFSRGRVRRVVPIDRAGDRIAIHPSMVEAIRQGHSRIEPSDLRGVQRVAPGDSLTVVVVDRSDSMGEMGIRTAAAHATAALEGAYRDRARVAVVVARGSEASVALRPSRGIRNAHRVIRDLPAGGGTPLASAFQLALDVTRQPNTTDLRVVILSDGAATVRLPGLSDESATEQAATMLRRLTAAASEVLVIPCTGGVRIRNADLDWMVAAGARLRR